MNAIEVKNLSKEFNLSRGKNLLNKNIERFAAIKDVSFSLKKGECLGVIGRNGSGKTTLLRLLAGIIKSDRGNIKIDGRLMSFIDLNAGINPELTGKENISLYASLLGMSKNEIKRKFNSIVDYAQIPKKFIDTKFKNYSSGMKVRLTFSVAMATDPDVLLIDEAISVGDESFQKKSFNKIKELKKERKTILLVSHSVINLIEVCDSILLLEEGKVIKNGKPSEIVNYYLSNIYDRDVFLLIEAVNNKKLEIKRLEKEIKNSRSRKPFFKKKNKQNYYIKISALKKEIVNQLFQIVHVLFWKNINLLNLEFHYIKNKKNKLKLNNLKEIKIDNNFNILENIFLMSEYLEDGTLSNKIINIAEGAFKDLCETISRFDETKRVVKCFQRLNSLTTSLGFLDSRKKTLSDFRYFVKQKAVRFNDKKFKKDLENLTRNLFTDQVIKNFSSIQEYEGDFREKFNLVENDKERQKLINDFLKICKNHLKKIKEKGERYLFFRNTYLSILQNLVSQIKDLNYKIIFVKKIKQLFDTKIALKNYESKYKKTIDILGSFLRNELMKLEDSYLELNLKLNESKDDSDKKEFIKKLENVKKLKLKLSESITKLYKKDFVNKKTTWGFGDIIIKNVEFFNSKNEKTNIFNSNERFLVRINFFAKKKVMKPEFGIAIHKENGINICNDRFVYNKNNRIFLGEGQIDFIINSLPLKQGNFLLSVSIYNLIMNIPYDHHYKAYPFEIQENTDSLQEGGLLAIKGKWKIN